MSKAQIWIVAAVVGVVAIIVGVKHFGGSAHEDESAPPRPLAQREAKAEHGGWSVRTNSQDIPSSDDVQVQRQAEAKPANAPPRRVEPMPPAGGQPAADTANPGAETANGDEKPAQPNSGVGGNAPPANAGSGAPQGGGGSIGSARETNPDGIEMNGDVIHAPSGPQVAGGSVAVNPQGGQIAPPVQQAVPPVQQAADTPGGNSARTPAQQQQGQATPGEVVTPGVESLGAIYDSKDATFSMDTPVEIKNVGTIPGAGVTMMIQLAPDYAPDNQEDANFLTLGDNLELYKNVHFLRLQYTDPNGHEWAIGSDMTNPVWQDIQPPYSVAATVNGNQMALVVNGTVVRADTLEGMQYESPTNPSLQIGCFGYPDSRPCAPTDASGVMIMPPISNQESMAHTKPAQNTGH